MKLLPTSVTNSGAIVAWSLSLKRIYLKAKTYLVANPYFINNFYSTFQVGVKKVIFVVFDFSVFGLKCLDHGSV